MTRSERNLTAQRALIELRTLILNGEFENGARLPETSLAERLGVSRTPLRQAMDRMVSEGLLDRNETGGCKVASFSLSDITDAIELRGVLEGTAARLAAERGVDETASLKMEETLEELDRVMEAEVLDFKAYVAANASFHAQLARLAGSSIIAREVERASRLPAASPTAFLQGQETIPDFRKSLQHAQRQHCAIWQAIKDREGTRAESLAREHARLARINLEYVMSDKSGLAQRVPGLSLVKQSSTQEEK